MNIVLGQIQNEVERVKDNFPTQNIVTTTDVLNLESAGRLTFVSNLGFELTE